MSSSSRVHNAFDRDYIDQLRSDRGEYGPDHRASGRSADVGWTIKFGS